MTVKRLKESKMDFKALMTKLESIDKRQVLNESATQPAKKTHKINLNENLDMKSSIARALMQEFGVNEEGPHPFDQQQYEPRGDVPAGPGMKDPAAALKHAWKYRTDQQGNLIGNRAKAELDNPDPSMSGDANIAGAANPAPAAQAAEPAGADQGAEAGAPPAQYDVDQAANIDSTSQAAPQAAGSQADDAFQQANQEPAQDDPAQGGDAIGQAQAATQPSAVPTAQTQPAAPAQPAAQQAGGARPPVTPAPGEGPTGVALAKFGVSKQDRLNQKFVDSILGPEKFKAGSAQANTALLAHFQKQAPAATAPAAAPAAASAAAPAGVVQGGSSVEENLNLIRRLAGL